MKDLIVEIVKIVAPITVALIVFAQGLGIALSQVGTYFREEPGLMLRSLIAPLVLVPAVAVAIGHLTGPRDPHEKTSLAVECGVRHPVLALTSAAANFSPQKALPC